jgi:hypothetical protein
MSRYYLIISVLVSLILVNCRPKETVQTSTGEKNDTLSYEMPKEYDTSIYIGRVTGNIPDSFLKNSEHYIKRDSLFGLNSLTASRNQVEVRFFTQNYWSDTSYCILLTYDTSFSIRGLKHYYIYDTITRNVEKRKSIVIKVSLTAKPGSLFEKLVENGVFSLNTPSSRTDYSNYPLLELTKKGFKEGTIIGDVLDGVDFTLEYKVDKLYDRIYINNPSTYFRHNPDFQISRRKYEITKLMLSGLK